MFNKTNQNNANVHKKLANKIKTLYLVNTIMILVSAVWYGLNSIPQFTNLLPNLTRILVNIGVLVIDVIHGILMLIIFLKINKNEYWKSIETKVIDKHNLNSKRIPSIYRYSLIALACYVVGIVGALALILSLSFNIHNGLINVLAGLNTASMIYRIIINKKAKKFVVLIINYLKQE
ncbi:MAG: hypothetical protein LBJ97_00660 [Mycoplasmataceae bacterium]|jgi:hypothetical protein|nr:hypothetical protein [Mycoplasmataceae bacterium]